MSVTFDELGITPTKIISFQEKILEWYDENKRDLPRRDSGNPYWVCVSEVMSQQTQVERVIPKFDAFIHELPNFDSLASVGRPDLLRLWSGLGFNSRAIRLQKTAQIVCEQYQGDLPKTREQLLLLPGIGRYCSSSILAFAYNIASPVIDTNIRRVLIWELGVPVDMTVGQLETVAALVTPEGKANDRNNALMDYGSLVATAAATGIKPTSKQGAFNGSPRQVRGNIVKWLLKHGKTSLITLKKEFPHNKFESIITGLLNDEMVKKQGNSLVL